jgi:hypothetical protein
MAARSPRYLPRAPASLRGSVTFNVSDEELVQPLDVEWDATTA